MSCLNLEFFISDQNDDFIKLQLHTFTYITEHMNTE